MAQYTDRRGKRPDSSQVYQDEPQYADQNAYKVCIKCGSVVPVQDTVCKTCGQAFETHPLQTNQGPKPPDRSQYYQENAQPATSTYPTQHSFPQSYNQSTASSQGPTPQQPAPAPPAQYQRQAPPAQPATVQNYPQPQSQYVPPPQSTPQTASSPTTAYPQDQAAHQVPISTVQRPQPSYAQPPLPSSQYGSPPSDQEPVAVHSRSEVSVQGPIQNTTLYPQSESSLEKAFSKHVLFGILILSLILGLVSYMVFISYSTDATMVKVAGILSHVGTTVAALFFIGAALFSKWPSPQGQLGLFLGGAVSLYLSFTGIGIGIGL